jgi:DNA-binding CsgD family transcriptional regulator
MSPKARAFPSLLALVLLFPFPAHAQTPAASRTVGENTLFYAALHHAFEAAAGTSIDAPDEITLLADIAVYEPLKVDDGKHIRLVPDGNRTMRRGSGFLEYPVIWVNGESASLTLGKPGMEGGLIIDGGYLNTPPIEAHAPLAAVSGPDSKLVMYDNVTLQNNCNNGSPPTTSYYQNGAGVFVRTAGDHNSHRLAEFIMKGGTIRGNNNNLQTPLANGGGVAVVGFGLFTMEGGVITGNTANRSGGGLCVGSRGSFNKTGGTIERNTALNGVGPPKTHGHAVIVHLIDNPFYQFRDDTVRESDRLSYTGSPKDNGVFGQGEKWSKPGDLNRRRYLLFIALPLALGAVVLALIARKKAAQNPPALFAQELPELGLSPREKQVFSQLLSGAAPKEIAYNLKIRYPTVNFHINNLYRKLGIQSRAELFAQYGKYAFKNT